MKQKYLQLKAAKTEQNFKDLVKQYKSPVKRQLNNDELSKKAQDDQQRSMKLLKEINKRFNLSKELNVADESDDQKESQTRESLINLLEV